MVCQKICSFLYKSKNVPINGEVFDNLISYLIAGIIVGGRIGYVIFYNPGLLFIQSHRNIENLGMVAYRFMEV